MCCRSFCYERRYLICGLGTVGKVGSQYLLGQGPLKSTLLPFLNPETTISNPEFGVYVILYIYIYMLYLAGNKQRGMRLAVELARSTTAGLDIYYGFLSLSSSLGGRDR